MKARIQKKQRKIALLYNIERNNSRQLASICTNNGITAIELDTTGAAFSVGYLCEYEGSSGDLIACDIPQEEAIVFSACSNNEISAVLEQMKKDGIKIDLKGMVTPTNKSWALGKLVSEFVKEREELSR